MMSLFQRLGGPARGVVLSVASGLLTALSMPGFGWWFAAFLALVPLLAAVWNARPGGAFLYGWLAGTVTFVVGMGWIADTVHTYGALPYLLAWPAALLLALYLGAYTGLFALGVAHLHRHHVSLVLAAPLLWVALEFLRAHLLTGLPWNLLGLALHGQVRLIQIAELGGIYGVSWMVVVLNVHLFALLRPLIDPARRGRQAYYYNHALALFLVPIVVATYGQVRIASLSLYQEEHPNPGGPVRVALVQPNIPQDIKWDRAYLNTILARMEEQTRRAARDGAELVLWPEASAPLVLERNPGAFRRASRLARDGGIYVGVGSLAPAPEDPGAVRNSLYLFAPDGSLSGIAAKEHLVPFGEYVPLERFLPFVRALTDGIGNVLPEADHGVLPHPRGTIGLAVCYEVIFPDLVRRRFAEGGADYLATITNDAWFGRSAAPEQHFANVAFRAVENRTYVVRAANTGISGMVDPFGIVRARSEMDTQDVLQVQVRPRFTGSFYSRHGDWFAWFSVIISAGCFLYAGLKGARRGRARPQGASPP